jgi:hypothetical protein
MTIVAAQVVPVYSSVVGGTLDYEPNLAQIGCLSQDLFDRVELPLDVSEPLEDRVEANKAKHRQLDRNGNFPEPQEMKLAESRWWDVGSIISRSFEDFRVGEVPHIAEERQFGFIDVQNILVTMKDLDALIVGLGGEQEDVCTAREVDLAFVAV